MEQWNMIPVQAHMAAKVCDRLWEEFNEYSEEVREFWGHGTEDALTALDELKERLMQVLPYGPREI